MANWLREPRVNGVWQNSYAAICGRDIWTSASTFTAGSTLDYILHSSELRTVAVLGEWPSAADLVDLLSRKFPSDHLLMLAIFEWKHEMHGRPSRRPSANGDRRLKRHATR
mmetsp:Transcript_93653/g.205003  ORF Transcript_93653/g.205003 Transcript_93653/m.205003 type:complete len:111 (-) Transcript_93653:215-547(-)